MILKPNKTAFASGLFNEFRLITRFLRCNKPHSVKKNAVKDCVRAFVSFYRKRVTYQKLDFRPRMKRSYGAKKQDRFILVRIENKRTVADNNGNWAYFFL